MTNPKAPEYSRLINTVVTLGSILIGLGILLFVASNWDKLSRPAQLTIIFSVIACFNFAGYYFRCVKDNFPGLGQGFLLMGAFAFGVGVWLVAQMYHIHYNYSAAFLFWVIGILPLAYLYRSWMILTLSSILSCIWLGCYIAYYPLRAAYGFFILAALLLYMVYAFQQRFSLFVIIVGCFIWLTNFFRLAYFATTSGPEDDLLFHLLLATAYAGFGIILYSLGMWHSRQGSRDRFSFLYKFLGVVALCLSTYSLTYTHHYYQEVSYLTQSPSKSVSAFIVMFVLAVTLLFQLYRSSKDTAEAGEIRLISYVLFLQVIAFILSYMCLKAVSLSYNLLLIFQILSFMCVGFLRRSEGLFRLAIVLFFLEVLSRYFDIFWKMMPRSLLFIGGGVILIAGAIFANKKRKELEQKMAQSQHP